METNKLNILLIGYKGKMGQECILCTQKKFANVNLMLAGKDDDLYDFDKVDVVLDYSHFSALHDVLDFAKKRKAALVIATTGHDEKQLKKIEDYSKSVPIFKATNFSVAVNKFIEAVSNFAKSWDGDIEIIETHHSKKADSPSGTAITIAQSIVKAKGGGNVVLHRTNENAKRIDGDVYISAVRGGVVPGTHEVRFFGDTCEISMKEAEYGRSSFAKGAIEACIWMVGKKAGKIYNMKNLLGEK